MATERLTEQIDRAERIAQAYERGRRLLRRLEGEGVAALRSLLVDLRREITGRINSATVGPRAQFTADLAAQVQADIREALNFVTRNATASVRSTLERAFDAGSRITPTALGAGGINAAFPTVAPALLTTLAQATEIALTELVSRLDQRIAEQLRLSAIGLEPTSAAVRRIEALLRTSRETDLGRRLRTGFAAQAESIVRTEINRIYQSAQAATSSILSDTIPGLRKRWVTTLANRRGHREAEARYAPGGEVGPIPVKDRFRVTDFSRSDRNVSGFWTTRTGAGFQRVYRGDARARRGSSRTDQMLHPLDPSASVGNIAQCFPVGTEVLTDQGWQAIETIPLGARVLTDKGRFKPVRQLHRNFVDQKLTVIHLPGQKRIRVTPLHEFFVKGKGWISAERLEAGDELVHFLEVSSLKNSIREVEHSEALIGQREMSQLRESAFSSIAFQPHAEKRQENIDVPIPGTALGRELAPISQNFMLTDELNIEQAESSLTEKFRDRDFLPVPISPQVSTDRALKRLARFSAALGVVFPLHLRHISSGSQGNIEKREKFPQGPGFIDSEFLGQVSDFSFLDEVVFPEPDAEIPDFRLTVLGDHQDAMLIGASAGTVDRIAGPVGVDQEIPATRSTGLRDTRRHTGSFQDDARMYRTRIVGISQEEFSGIVYNLGVADDHTYFASGVLCHNCTCLVLEVLPGLENAQQQTLGILQGG